MVGITNLLALLFPPRSTEILVATTHLHDLQQKVDPRKVPLEGDTEVIALLPFNDVLVHACIVEAKYYRNARAHTLLGEVLREYVSTNAPCTLIPVPLSPKRRHVRGYNQVEEICRRALPPTWTLSTNLLVRTRDTLPQTQLTREERVRNMESAFEVRARNYPPSCVLVDDVVTTGSTLSEAARALTTKGIHDVQVIALAYSLRK